MASPCCLIPSRAPCRRTRGGGRPAHGTSPPIMPHPTDAHLLLRALCDELGRCGIALSPIDDTMLISYALEAGLHKSHGMDELSKRWLEHQPIKFASVTGSGKAQKSFKHVPLEPATCYAAEDADVTLRLYQHLRPRLIAELA